MLLDHRAGEHGRAHGFAARSPARSPWCWWRLRRGRKISLPRIHIGHQLVQKLVFRLLHEVVEIPWRLHISTAVETAAFAFSTDLGGWRDCTQHGGVMRVLRSNWHGALERGSGCGNCVA